MIRIFRHYIPKSLFFQGAIEAVILLFSVYLGVSLRILVTDTGMGGADDMLLPKALLFVVVMIATMTAMGLYQRDMHETMQAVIMRIGASFLLGLVVMLVVLYPMLPVMPTGSALGVALVAAFYGIVMSRLVFYKLSDVKKFRQNVLVLGSGKVAWQIQNLKRRSDWRGTELAGFVEMNGTDERIDRGSLISPDRPLRQLVEERHVDVLVLAVDACSQPQLAEEVLDCKLAGVEVVHAMTFFERQTGMIALDAIEKSLMILADGYDLTGFKMWLKRVFDVVFSSIILLLSLPLMLLAVLAILIECRCKGPVLYRQVRVGKDGKPFELLKFRSMRVDAEDEGAPRWARPEDQRATSVGRWLRKYRIDELPQLVNVLAGDMSLVGPRPERPEFVVRLERSIPYYSVRHRVKPGITGWAQVCYSYGASIHDARQKLQYDLYYLKNFSLFLDFTVLFQTVQRILWGGGAR